MKYYIIAGEASGDLHGSNLISAISTLDEQADFRVWGGDKMEAAGGRLVKHYRDLAFMGFWEVAKNIRTILGNIRLCKDDIERYQPDALILIDYPGFNLRIAEWAKKNSHRVFYYISPQVWAWNRSRVHKIKESVDEMFVILPFEDAFYKNYQVEVTYVGHPLLDVIPNHQPEAKFLEKYGLAEKKVIALLPGSRRQEISRMLKEMVSVIPQFSGYQFAVACAPSIEPEYYQQILEESGHKDASVVFIPNQTYNLLSVAHAALVTSGTATLETALFKVPQVVCYKGSWLSYQIARRLVDIKYISLVNLIADEKVVEELIQNDCNAERINEELSQILEGSKREQVFEGYEKVHSALRIEGSAAGKVASGIFRKLQSK